MLAPAHVPRTAFLIIGLALVAGSVGCGDDGPSGGSPLPTPTPSTSPLVFTDQTFAPGDWPTGATEIIVVGPTGGSGSASQQTGGGNSGAYREVVASKNGTAGTGQSGATWVFSFKPAATYNPTQQGAVTSIDFAVDAMQFVQADVSGGSVALALPQGGTRYYAPHPQSPGGGQLAVPERSWTRKARTGLMQSDFRDNDQTGRALNFSASGGPITLGFVYWVSTPIDGALSARTAGFDNWTVTVRR
jgi:hypothetical protein